MVKTLSLNSNQRPRAYEILRRLRDEEIEHPLNVLDKWESVEERYDYWANVHDLEGEVTREKRYVAVPDIVGTLHKDLTDPSKFKARRLEKIVKWLISGCFEKEHHAPPILEQIQDRYYVSANGNHRVIAFKAIGIEEMYATVAEIPLTN